MHCMKEMVARSACAKIILCGEHAVVYGRPAIAVPLSRLRATAQIQPHDSRFTIYASDIDHVVYLPKFHAAKLRRPHPLALVSQLTLDFLKAKPPRAKLTLSSTIPIGSNLGSGAAVSIACARAIAAYFDHELSPVDASALVFEVEKLHHGTPSGIDNTVIAYEQPIWFVKGEAPRALELRDQLNLVVADTGISTPTRIAVGEVRTGWERARDRYEGLFSAIASLVQIAREALMTNDLVKLGEAMNANHILLQQLGVSCKELDGLCDAGRNAGALGAKMSGGGRGGNMIALAMDATHAQKIKEALLSAGARGVY